MCSITGVLKSVWFLSSEDGAALRQEQVLGLYLLHSRDTSQINGFCPVNYLGKRADAQTAGLG